MPGMTDVHVHLTQNSGEPWYAGFTQKYSNPYAATRRPHPRAGNGARRASPPCATSAATPAPSSRSATRSPKGAFPGPRIKVSGAPLSIIGGHADDATGLPPELAAAVNEAHLNPSVCTGVEECQKVVRELAAAGVDVIKIMATGGVLDPGAMGLEQHFTDAEMKAIVDMAHAMHLKVAAHAHGARGILAATNAGVDSIEHGTFIDEAGRRAR